jgi:hypothetical protein
MHARCAHISSLYRRRNDRYYGARRGYLGHHQQRIRPDSIGRLRALDRKPHGGDTPVSVPEGETGTISITGGDDATLLTEKNAGPDGYFNPNVDAVLDLIEDELGNGAGYDGYSDKDFLPEGVKFNNPYPFKADISNFVLYDIGSFANSSNAVSNYSTDEPIAYNVADGQEKIYSVLVEGFSSVHFDVYGYVQTEKNGICESTWAINPASHDAAYMVPEPATILLLGLGSTVLVRPRTRQRRSRLR